MNPTDRRKNQRKSSLKAFPDGHSPRCSMQGLIYQGIQYGNALGCYNYCPVHAKAWFHQLMGGRQKHKNLDLKGGWHRLEVTDSVRRGISPSLAGEHRRAQGAGEGEEGTVSKILLLTTL